MNIKTTLLVNLPLLLLAVLAFPAHAATNPDALEVEQQQFLNAQSQQSTLNTEQDHFLQTNLPVGQKPQAQYSTAARWPQPVAQPEVTPQPEITLAVVAQPLPDAVPAPIQRNIEPVQSVQAIVPVIRPLPSLKMPEGYSRVIPLSNPNRSDSGGILPSLVVPISSAPPQIAFALPPSLDGFLNRLQLGAERLLYPLVHPVAITSIFGWRTHPIYGGARFHTGIDLGAPIGSPVLAAFTGTVVSADWMGGYGNAIVLQHGAGLRSLYAHLSESLVRPGQTVMQGTVIGLSGSTGNSTGPHLHFETRRLTDGEWIAFDPGTDLKAAQRGLMAATQQISRFNALK